MGMTPSAPSGGKARPNPVINITPLVDVVLVVLIIFMIVTTMMTRTFSLNLPKEEKKEAAPSDDDVKPVVLTIDRAGVIRANQTVLSKAEVRERVIRMLAAKNQKTLFFDAHDQVPYAQAVEAIDLVRAGGVKSIAMLTETVVK
jgi:biopolymer transport protein ExbD/biopolymer transport protein TolR